MARDRTAQAIREHISDVYDLVNDLHGFDLIQQAYVEDYHQEQSDPLVVVGNIRIFVDPVQGGKTRSLKARIKESVGSYPGVYITDFQSPRQRTDGPKSNEANEDFYARTPYLVEFRYDEDDKTAARDKDSTTSRRFRIACRLARRVQGRPLKRADEEEDGNSEDDRYEPEDSMEWVMGEVLTQQLGVTDAPRSFFKDVKETIPDVAEDDSIESWEDLDLEKDESYPIVNRAVMEVAKRDEYDYIEGGA